MLGEMESRRKRHLSPVNDEQPHPVDPAEKATAPGQVRDCRRPAIRSLPSRSRVLSASTAAHPCLLAAATNAASRSSYAFYGSQSMPETGIAAALADNDGNAAGSGETQRQEALLKTGTLQNAILTSANFAIIATDEKGIIQLFNIGCRALAGLPRRRGREQRSPSEMHDPQEVMARAQALSRELATPIAPGFEAWPSRLRAGSRTSTRRPSSARMAAALPPRCRSRHCATTRANSSAIC
jgi:PAS domain-containing protein